MQTIYLDISNKGVIPCIQAKQSEVGRKFLAVITDNGVPYNIPDNSLLSVWYEGDTDAGNYSSIEEKSAFVIDGNKVEVELVAQMLLKPGKGEMCLSISHGNGNETNTWNIPYEVEYKPGAGSAVPTEYYTALTDAAARAAEQVGFAAEQVALATEQVSVAEQYAKQSGEYASQAQEAVTGYVKADGSVPMTGNFSLGGNKVTNVAEPDSDADAATKSYVDALVALSKKTVYVEKENENLDDYTEDGVYYFRSTRTPVNIPVGSNGWLIVLGSDQRLYKQIWLRGGSPGSNDHQTFIRTATSDGWGEWVQLLTNKLTSGLNYGTSLPEDGNFTGRVFYLYQNGDYSTKIYDGSSWK